MQLDNRIIELYQKYADTVYRIAFLMLNNTTDAEDVMQNTFEKLIKSKKVFFSDEYAKAWLILAAKNTARDALKSAWRRKTVPFEDFNEPAFIEEYNKEVYIGVMKLNYKYRIPLYLYYYEGYSTEEISHILKINHSTVRSQLKTAREKLKLILEV